MRYLLLISLLVLAGNSPAETTNTTLRREIKASNTYLHLPVKTGAPKRWVSLLVEGKTVRDFEIELATDQPDWWAFVELAPFKGKSVTIEVDGVPASEPGLRAISQSDAIPSLNTLYQEALRPQFHFSQRRGWNNDPNGLVFFRGEYHLFFQHNPYGWNWGNMHWGHAVSRDLLHWRELGEALYPDSQGTMFSGSAVVDFRNMSGLNPKGGPVMACFYTAAGDTSRQSAKQPFTQCLAYSLDGRTFAKYESNPILGNITSGNRDPKVIWHAPSKKWVMVLYVEVNKVHTIQFFNSPDLKHWTFLSQVDGFFECPDFFELPVDGQAGAKKWVLTAASSEYRVGTFDGQKFQPETDKLSGHLGQGFYAAQTYSDMPDHRRIQFGWLQAPAPGMPFNQCMTIPLELTLKSTAQGPRLAWQPIKEMNRLRKKKWSLGKLALAPKAANPAAKVNAELVEMRAEFRPATNSVTSFNIRGVNLEYDAAKQELVVNGRRLAAPLRKGRQSLTVYVDRTAIEVFACDGLVYVPCPFIPAAGNRTSEVSSKNAATQFQKLEFYELKPIWER